jgi:hypothetical protein
LEVGTVNPRFLGIFPWNCFPGSQHFEWDDPRLRASQFAGLVAERLRRPHRGSMLEREHHLAVITLD